MSLEFKVVKMFLMIVMFVRALALVRSQTADYCAVKFCSMFRLGNHTMCLYPEPVINMNIECIIPDVYYFI